MSRIKAALPLHLFIRQRQIIQLYRTLLKESNRISDSSVSNEIKNQVKTEFRAHQFLKDNNAIKSSIQKARNSVKLIEDMTRSSRTVPEGDSWMSISDEEDKRGRVGAGWPWG